ncbi:TonB-dependent receptor family protein [Marinicella sediminis]|uniref:TonB-dependent receptor family protein n=1 Tax=Marinicella sediminis TaxID=1792834 RepID=A0ABV7JG71_9GAMM|nr:TonB-dependent receptor [Marinicella sediminis]
MTHNTAVLIIAMISTVGHAQPEDTDEDQTTDEQPIMVVSEDQDLIPEPLQQKAAEVRRWSGSSHMTTDSEWLQQRAINVKDLLDEVPGVYVQQRNGAESARLSIRGSGLGRQFQGGGLLLLQDGVPLNTADGSFDFQAIDPLLTDFVTSFRGANGMALGGSTLGGVINFGTTLPNPTDPTELQLSYGAYSTRQLMLSMSDIFSESLDDAFRLRLSHFNQTGFREQNEQRSNRLDLQYLHNTETDAQHRFSLFHLNSHAALPSSLSKALLFEDPRQSRGFNINGNFHRDLTLTRLAWQHERQWHNETQLNAMVYFSARRLDNPVFTYINRDSDDAGIRFDWQHNNHQLSLFSQWGNQDERRRENEGGLPGAERLYREQQAQTHTLFYQYSTTWLRPELTLQLGLQGSYASRNIDERFPESIGIDRNYHQFNPRFGLLFQPTANIQWYTNLSRSFEPPSFAELNNGNQPGVNIPVKAQTADTFELGSRGFSGRFNWDLSVYYSQLQDEFIRFRFPDGATRTTNADDSVHWGLEAYLNWQLTEDLLANSDQLSLKTLYLYNRFRLNDDPTFGNNRIPGIPEHYLLSQLVYQHPTGWTITPHIEWVPTAWYVDLANSFRADRYLLTGLSIAYTTPGGFEFFIDAKNLADRSYITTTLPIPDAGGTDGNFFYSGEGRAYYSGFRWSF